MQQFQLQSHQTKVELNPTVWETKLDVGKEWNEAKKNEANMQTRASMCTHSINFAKLRKRERVRKRALESPGDHKVNRFSWDSICIISFCSVRSIDFQRFSSHYIFTIAFPFSFAWTSPLISFVLSFFLCLFSFSFLFCNGFLERKTSIHLKCVRMHGAYGKAENFFSFVCKRDTNNKCVNETFNSSAKIAWSFASAIGIIYVWEIT